MKTTRLRRLKLTNLSLLALSILFAPAVKAQCGAAARSAGTLPPQLRNFQQPAAQNGGDFSDEAASPQASDEGITVLGLWKKVYFSGGELNDIGFAQFSAGGTELLNDVGAFNGGNNFCVGAWKRVGPRSYDLLHTFYLLDGKQAIGVSIEKSHFTVSRDGNRFKGTWTQDNYDLSGNLIPGFHFDGTITGTRIAPGLDYPFPLPL